MAETTAPVAEPAEPAANPSEPSGPRKWLGGLGGLLLLAAALHLPALGQPLLGPFSTKQAVYGAIARNWSAGRASWPLPTLDEIRGSGRGLHLLEWPLPVAVAAWLHRTCGGSIEVWGRAVAATAMFVGLAALYDLVRRRWGPTAAWGTGLAWTLSPVALRYGHAFMLEGWVAASLAVSAWAFYCGAGHAREPRSDGPQTDVSPLGRRLAGVLLCLAMMVGMLTKIYVAAFLPLLLWAAASRGRGCLLRTLGLFLLAALPAAGWVAFSLSAEGGGWGIDPRRIYFSLADTRRTHPWPAPEWTSPAFYRDLLDTLTGPVCGTLGAGLLLFASGRPEQRRWCAALPIVGLLAMLAPRKFAELEYYWLALLPAFCVPIGLGWANVAPHVGRVGRWAFVLGWLVLSARHATSYYLLTADDRAVLAAAEEVRRRVPPETPILTLHGAAPDLLFCCDRPGRIWAVSPEPALPRLRATLSAGTRYVVAAGHGMTDLAPLLADPATAALLRPVSSGPGWALYEADPGP